MKKPEELIEVEKLETEGKLKEIVKSWEAEYNKLKGLEKKEEFGSEKYFKISKQRAIIGEKLHWSRLTPEERERKLAESEALKKDMEVYKKETDEIKSKLSKDELEIYDFIKKFVSRCSGRPCVYAATMDDASKQISKRQEDASKIMDAVISKTGNCDLEAFRKYMTKEDWPYFVRYYKGYKENRCPILFSMVIGR